MVEVSDNRLGDYLKNRRTKLDPSALGLTVGRRRTAGLRREEVAQRANISAAWYTWLEQGRGGNPSADVLDRLAKALILSDVEREHLFLLGLGRPPEVQYRAVEAITPRLQRLLDAFPYSPAMVRTATWDVVAWNEAAAALFPELGVRPAKELNCLRMMFQDSAVRAAQFDWENVARFVVSAFRLDASRAGAEVDAEPLVRELCASSPEFAAMWQEHDLLAHGGDGVKRVRHPTLGEIGLEYSILAVDGRPDLQLLVLNPLTAADQASIQRLMADARRPR